MCPDLLVLGYPETGNGSMTTFRGAAGGSTETSFRLSDLLLVVTATPPGDRAESRQRQRLEPGYLFWPGARSDGLPVVSRQLEAPGFPMCASPPSDCPGAAPLWSVSCT